MKATSKKKWKFFLRDSVYSISGLMIANVIAQFCVYPIWAGRLGDTQYGDIIFLLSLMNIFAIGIGSACNYAIMKHSVQKETNVFNYNIFMLCASLCISPVFYLFYRLTDSQAEVIESITYVMLAIATMWRFYLDVEFRLKTHYKNFFWYYVIIGVGYLIGIVLFYQTGIWALALLPGELSGIIFVFFKEKTYQRTYIKQEKPFANEIKVILILFLTNVLSHVIFNGDRILLKIFMDSDAVTDYYIASLLGKSLTLITTPMNSVIIGYLVKHNFEFDCKFMNRITIGTIVIVGIAGLVCQGASHIVVSVLYPQNYEAVKDFFGIANIAQILYFIGNTITVLLLRFCKNSYQILINLVYAVAFIVLCLWGIHYDDFKVFCYMVAAASFIRLVYALGLGYYSVLCKKNIKVE